METERLEEGDPARALDPQVIRAREYMAAHKASMRQEDAAQWELLWREAMTYAANILAVVEARSRFAKSVQGSVTISLR